jgi:hypothetical protein
MANGAGVHMVRVAAPRDAPVASTPPAERTVRERRGAPWLILIPVACLVLAMVFVEALFCFTTVQGAKLGTAGPITRAAPTPDGVPTPFELEEGRPWPRRSPAFTR